MCVTHHHARFLWTILLTHKSPNSLASLATHIAATAWAGFQLAHTARFRRNFNRVITNGACSTPAETDANGFLLSGYWVERSKAEIPILALNVLALGISVLLTWKLVKVCLRPLFCICGGNSEGVCVVLRLANLQARRCIQADQQDLQVRPHAVDHDPALCVLHGRDCWSLARPAVEWADRKACVVQADVSDYLHDRWCGTSSLLSTSVW